MVFIELGNTKNLYVGHLYYVSDFTADGKPIYKISTNKYLFIKNDNGYCEYFSKIGFKTVDEEKLALTMKDDLGPRIVNLISFSDYYPDVAGIDDTTLMILLDEINTTKKIGVIKEDKHVLKVSEVFSETPGARYRSDGEYSAEEFRDDILVPYLYKCKSLNCKLVIDLDGGYGYATCFLEEVFGGLVRLGFDKDDLLDRIEIISNEEPDLIYEIKEFISEARKAKKAYKMP